MTRRVHRPQSHGERGDSHLALVLKQLRHALTDVQRDFAHDTLRLASDALDELAGLLVDFALDLHNGTGIWAAYERYNTAYFGAALPMTSGESGGDSGTSLHPDRFRHFLWILYPMLLDGLVLSPTHQDLQHVAEASSGFLSDASSSIPRGSEGKTALGGSNAHGWDVKRKLVWLGTQSFMFRLPFARYMEEQGADRSDISRTDDFICQECTRWSGLGAIDILAGVLDVSADDRQGSAGLVRAARRVL